MNLKKGVIHTKGLKGIVISAFIIFSVNGTAAAAGYSALLNRFPRRPEDCIPVSVMGTMWINTGMTRITPSSKIKLIQS